MRRRRFIELSALAFFLLGPGSAFAQAPPERPNVIVIVTDDQGTLDTHLYGSEDLITPHMDALARRGVRFTQFYAASAVCAPSRAALMTGRYPLRAGVPSNAESHPSQFGSGAGLPAEQVTLAEVLREAGYRTAHFGKWHLGTRPGPNGQGFEESFGFLGGVVDKWSHFNYGQGSWGMPPRWHDLYHNGEEVWEPGTHTGDLIAREAVRFMEASGNRPFFMYLAFGNPHYPVQGYAKYRAQYAELPEPRRSYAAAISTVDEQIGQVLTRLDELGLREETLIVFQSDHGHSVEARASHGAGNAGPYRGAKASLFEGGIRVPAIVSMPGTLPEGAVRDQLAHGTDWLPTIAAMTGAALPNVDLDGKSLREVLLEDAPSPHDVVHWQLGDGAEAQWAVREGDWKLIGNPRDPTTPQPLADELYLTNLALDPSEQTNLAADHPDVARRLKGLHEAWRGSGEFGKYGEGEKRSREGKGERGKEEGRRGGEKKDEGCDKHE